MSEPLKIPEGKIPCDFCDEVVTCLGKGEAKPEECKIIFVNGEPRAIRVKPITMLCHRGDMKFDVPEVIEISSPETLFRTKRLKQSELDFMHVCGIKELFDLVFAAVPTIQLPKDIKELQREGSGVQHVVGMLVMIYEAMLDGRQFFLRNPETHLHPTAQLGLADMLIKLTQGGKQ